MQQSLLFTKSTREKLGGPDGGGAAPTGHINDTIEFRVGMIDSLFISDTTMMPIVA